MPAFPLTVAEPVNHRPPEKNLLGWVVMQFDLPTPIIAPYLILVACKIIILQTFVILTVCFYVFVLSLCSYMVSVAFERPKGLALHFLWKKQVSLTHSAAF